MKKTIVSIGLGVFAAVAVSFAFADTAPTLYKIAYDLEEEPLTEESLCRRLQEIDDLCRGWRTNETFPQF